MCIIPICSIYNIICIKYIFNDDNFAVLFHWTYKVEIFRRATAMCVICQWMAVLD